MGDGARCRPRRGWRQRGGGGLHHGDLGRVRGDPKGQKDQTRNRRGRVGDARIPAGQISFDLYKGSQFEPGDKRPIATGIATGDLVLIPEGTYHVVSNYGDANATVRSDIRVQTGKLTDATVSHRAAIVTLKLVNERGGEARANTQWSVLTPGGDVIKESIGAFPRVVLAEGDYRVIARNDGRSFQHEFKVVPGVDREISVVAR